MESPSDARFELAALRLHLTMGMAAADDYIHDREVELLHEFISGLEHIEPHERSQLRDMLTKLQEDPPSLESLLRSLVELGTTPELAQMLVADLVAIANVDLKIDPREEGMLRLVCGALEIDPVTLYEEADRARTDVSGADLALLVRDLLGLDAAA